MLATSEVGRKFSNPPIEREEWVRNRTEQIVNDDDYFPDLVQYMLQTNEGVNALLHLKKATYGDLLSASAHFHTYLTREARKIAESEANVRFTYLWSN